MISAGDFKGKKSLVNGLIYQAIIKGTDRISTLPGSDLMYDRERASTSAVFIHALRGFYLMMPVPKMMMIYSVNIHTHG
ncbi:hypothetical protein ACLB1Q_34990 [Escherichia coli]